MEGFQSLWWWKSVRMAHHFSVWFLLCHLFYIRLLTQNHSKVHHRHVGYNSFCLQELCIVNPHRQSLATFLYIHYLQMLFLNVFFHLSTPLSLRKLPWKALEHLQLLIDQVIQDNNLMKSLKHVTQESKLFYSSFPLKSLSNLI